MKRLVIGAALASAGAFAVRRLAGKARKMHAHCLDLCAGCKELQSTEPRAEGS
jgi:hypothetical protein